jgi:TatD DNase family protein
VGVDLESSKKAIALAEANEGIFATVGLHPADNRGEVFQAEEYRTLLAHPKVVGVGECGLDYKRVRGDVQADKRRQQNGFEAQLELAVAEDKPLMIHCRDAHEEMIDILSVKKNEHGEKLRGNIHFFTGSLAIAKRYFDLDFTVSFTGVITFASSYDEVVREAPLDRLLTETDCPFAAPVPYRGKRAEPIHVREVVAKIASIRGEDEASVRAQLVGNAVRLFNLAP